MCLFASFILIILHSDKVQKDQKNQNGLNHFLLVVIFAFLTFFDSFSIIFWINNRFSFSALSSFNIDVD